MEKECRMNGRKPESPFRLIILVELSEISLTSTACSIKSFSILTKDDYPRQSSLCKWWVWWIFVDIWKLRWDHLRGSSWSSHNATADLSFWTFQNGILLHNGLSKPIQIAMDNSYLTCAGWRLQDGNPNTILVLML